MNVRKKKTGKAAILPAVVFCLSILSMFSRSLRFSEPAIYVSLAGLLSVCLYFFNRGLSDIFITLWILVQLVIVKSTVENNSAALDMVQGFGLPVYLPLTMGGDGYQLGINLVAIVLLVLLVARPPEDLIGHNLHFAPYRGENNLGIRFPLKGKVERKLCLSDEKDWLLVNLKEPVKCKGKQVSYALICRNDKQPLIRHQTNQLVFFKPVEDVNVLNDNWNDKNNFKDEVWALCR